MSQTQARALVDIATADLEILADAVVNGHLEHLHGAALRRLALGHLTGRLGPLDDCPAQLAAAVLEAALAERRHSASPHLELVWTGPEAGLRPARDTAVVVSELFARAQHRVLDKDLRSRPNRNIPKHLRGIETAGCHPNSS